MCRLLDIQPFQSDMQFLGHNAVNRYKRGAIPSPVFSLAKMRQLLDTEVVRSGMQFPGSDGFDRTEFSELRFLGPGPGFLLTKMCQLLDIDAVGNKLQF